MTDSRRAQGRDNLMFWRLWTAQTTSAFGTAVTTVALPLVAVLELDATTFQTTLVAAATMCAWLFFGLPAGVLVHRLPLRPVLVATDLIRAFSLLSVPAAVLLHSLTLTQLVLVAFVLSVASVIFDVGYSTYLPAVVSEDRLTASNSLMQGSESVSQVAGPALGGILVQAFGAAYSLIADVVSYFVSAFLLLTIPSPRREVPEKATTSMVTQIREGLEYVRRDSVIRPSVLTATAFNFTTAAIEALTAVFLIRTVHTNSAMVGILIGSMGVGGVIGAAITTSLIDRMGTTRTSIIAVVGSPVFALMLPMTFRGVGLVLFGVGSLGWGACMIMFAIIARTHRQLATPPELFPRVMATVRFISWGVLPIGAVIAGVLGEAIGNRASLLIFCLFTLLIPVPFLCSPLRRTRDLRDFVPSPVSSESVKSPASR